VFTHCLRMYSKFYTYIGSLRRSHLNDIRDRSVLRLFESAEGGPLPQGLTIAAPTWDQDQSYFSEPEFDSEYQHQHIHKTKVSRNVMHLYSIIIPSIIVGNLLNFRANQTNLVDFVKAM